MWEHPNYFNQKQTNVLSFNMEKLEFLPPSAPTSFSNARLTWDITTDISMDITDILTESATVL